MPETLTREETPPTAQVVDNNRRNAFSRAAVQWLAAAVVVGAALVALHAVMDLRALLSALNEVYHTRVPFPIRRFVWTTKTVCSNPVTWIALLAVFAAERIIPAKRQRVFSVGLAQDFAWFAADAALRLTLIPVYIGLLKMLYDGHLGFLTIHAVERWPMSARVVMSLVAFDFLNWFHHLVRHYVELFWYFHMVHHSQRQMNLFTDARVHLVDFLIGNTLTFVPMFMLQLSTASVTWIALVTGWYARIYHANLRTNYGVLKHVMVTPQSHRVHHSLDPRHRNKNFGVLLTVWDRMFGTLHASYDEYPDTGIEDTRFPLERTVAGLGLVTNYVAQFVYPFRLVLDHLGARARHA